MSIEAYQQYLERVIEIQKNLKPEHPHSIGDAFHDISNILNTIFANLSLAELSDFVDEANTITHHRFNLYVDTFHSKHFPDFTHTIRIADLQTIADNFGVSPQDIVSKYRDL